MSPAIHEIWEFAQFVVIPSVAISAGVTGLKMGIKSAIDMFKNIEHKGDNEDKINKLAAVMDAYKSHVATMNGNSTVPAVSQIVSPNNEKLLKFASESQDYSMQTNGIHGTLAVRRLQAWEHRNNTELGNYVQTVWEPALAEAYKSYMEKRGIKEIGADIGDVSDDRLMDIVKKGARVHWNYNLSDKLDQKIKELMSSDEFKDLPLFDKDGKKTLLGALVSDACWHTGHEMIQGNGNNPGYGVFAATNTALMEIHAEAARNLPQPETSDSDVQAFWNAAQETTIRWDLQKDADTPIISPSQYNKFFKPEEKEQGIPAFQRAEQSLALG